MEALEEFSGSNDHNLIVKGKRTKRQRPSSPVGTAAVTSSLSSGSGGGGSATSDGGGGDFSVPSPISSGEIFTNKEEDEDMANCLILLAQGFGARQVEEEEGKMEKLSSRKIFTEMATTTTTTRKAGFYVYECKTCSRTFPSFQALGGHRASHKKPKIVAEEKIRSLPITQLSFDEEGEGEEEEERQFVKISPPLSLQMASNKGNTSTKSKVHECSICGSEFSSGQALGGHMRRHRAPPNARIGMNMVEMNMNTNTSDQSRDESDGQRNILGLDLNLPAPPEDDHHKDSNFQFTAAPNKHLVFSAPALVDCHY